LRVSLTIAVSGQPADRRAASWPRVEKPEMFLGMAQMFLPDLAALGPGQRATAWPPESLLPVPAWRFCGHFDEAIGLLGDGERPACSRPDREPARRACSSSATTPAYLEYGTLTGT
jgi:hypothetical protein